VSDAVPNDAQDLAGPLTAEVFPGDEPTTPAEQEFSDLLRRTPVS